MHRATRAAVWAASALATTLPTLLAHNPAPSPTFLNQALAFGLWAVFVAVTAPRRVQLGLGAPEAALGLVSVSVLLAWGPGSLPSTLALSALGTLAAALLMLLAGRACAGAMVQADVGLAAQGRRVFEAFCWGWLVAALANTAIALVQVFAPGLTGEDWIAASGLVGRAVGNLRQPNHLSSVLLWGAIATVALVQLRRLPLRWAAPALALMLWAVVLTASRTGIVGVVLLALWGLLDRRSRPGLRALLIAAPLAYALLWWLMTQWAAGTQQTFGGAARLAAADISSSRFAIWADTLALIRAQPWAGVGWGEFNLAWSLTPLPGRPTPFFDHAHNLPLHLAAEMGLPLALAVMALLLASLGRAAWRAARAGPSAPVPDASQDAPQDAAASAVCARAAVMMVLMIGLHSLLEYPLWYSYFLLPTAWLLGLAVALGASLAQGSRGPQAAAAPAEPGPQPTQGLAAPWLRAPAALLLAGTLFAVHDYLSVTRIFVARSGDAPLLQRVEEGRRSVFFGHHADYAAVTSGLPVQNPEAAYARASHYLLDTRLMIAWAQALAERGDGQAAAHLAARLREFRKPEAASFFAPCANPASAPLAFQCQGLADEAAARSAVRLRSSAPFDP